MSYCLWFTGCPASGKTTVGKVVAEKIGGQLLDGDVFRGSYISKKVNDEVIEDIGFGKMERTLHLLRAAEIAKLLLDNGVPVVATFISPYREVREQIRDIIGADRFHEVFVQASLKVRQERDPKGLYAKAARGEIHGLTGYDADYEVPENPALILDTEPETVADSVKHVMEYVESLK